MYQWVEGISLRRDMVELRQSTHKIRTDLAKTPDPYWSSTTPRLWGTPSTRCTSLWTAYHLEETWWSWDNPLKRCARTLRRRWTQNWSSTTPRLWVTPSTMCTSQWRAYHLEETWWSSDNPLTRSARTLRRRQTHNWSSTTPRLWVTPCTICTSLWGA